MYGPAAGLTCKATVCSGVTSQKLSSWLAMITAADPAAIGPLMGASLLLASSTALLCAVACVDDPAQCQHPASTQHAYPDQAHPSNTRTVRSL